MVMVRCPRCGARYETTLPAAGVLRVRRCAVCNRSGLEIVDDEAARGEDAARSDDEARGSRKT